MTDERWQVVAFPLRGLQLLAARTPAGDRAYVSLRTVCEAGGLSFAAVFSYLLSNADTFFWLDYKTEVLDQDGNARSGLFVFVEHLVSLPGYLLHLTPPGPGREKFKEIVLEARDRLADYYFRGVAVNPRFSPEGIRLRQAELKVEELRLCKEILSLGQLDPRDEIILKDAVRNKLLLGTSRDGAVATAFVTISERYAHLGYPPSAVRDHYQGLGEKASLFYQRKHGHRPRRETKHPQFVVGAKREVDTYTETDLPDVVDPAIHEWCRERGIRPRALPTTDMDAFR